jgi:hypothetical protein
MDNEKLITRLDYCIELLRFSRDKHEMDLHTRGITAQVIRLIQETIEELKSNAKEK